MSKIPEFFSLYNESINLQLQELIDQYSLPNSKLAEAMRYSTLLGGKRIRPILLLATAESFGVPLDKALPAACAIEMIHAYSLIHDDLPAMDDDELRRGQATCHIAFSEATAILAGDALQTMAFEIIANQENIAASNRLELIQIISRAAGARGMVLGQAIDLESVGTALDLSALENMHRLKTGALIEASVVAGAYCGQVEPDKNNIDALKAFARALGLAFQVQDDILDVVGDTEKLGKQQGADIALNKPTYPALMGLEGAQSKLKDLRERAYRNLEETRDIDIEKLKRICDFVIQREH